MFTRSRTTNPQKAQTARTSVRSSKALLMPRSIELELKSIADSRYVGCREIVTELVQRGLVLTADRFDRSEACLLAEIAYLSFQHESRRGGEKE